MEVKLLKGCGCLGLFVLVAAIVFPFFAQPGYRASPTSVCRRHLKQVGLGLVQYASEFDERMPSRDAWMDALALYVKDERDLHCPSVPKVAYGYAFNAALSHSSTDKLDAPATSVVVYDSVNPLRNASDAVTSLPSPGRHRGEDMIGYADGHVRSKRFGVAP